MSLKLYKVVAIVGSREFTDYEQLKREALKHITGDDQIVSGGAKGADSMAQRLAKEEGRTITVIYPNWKLGNGAGFIRNKQIVQAADVVLAFYQKGRFQQGGTANTAKWARELNVPLFEFEEC